jgi:hypothetical protein
MQDPEICCDQRGTVAGIAGVLLAGERVPREGERAAVEQIRGGALWPKTRTTAVTL